MKWILFYIMVGDSTLAFDMREYATMNECFAAREELIEEVGRPIVNYQAICVPSTFVEKNA
jgi:hypothetical protein